MNLFDEPQKIIVDKTLFAMIVQCIEDGKITATDSIDTIIEIVYPAIVENIDNIDVKFIYTDSLLKSTNILLEQKMYNESIIMAMTCIEHMLNDFYGEYFERNVQMSNAKTNDLLKVTSTIDKIGSLYLLTFREEFPPQLYSKIYNLNKKRNEFVHYKSPKIKLDDWDQIYEKDEEIKKMASDSPQIIDELERFFEAKKNALYESNRIAQEIFDKIQAKKQEEINNG